MLAIVSLLVIVTLSLLVTRAAAVALMYTGLSHETARRLAGPQDNRRSESRPGRSDGLGHPPQGWNVHRRTYPSDPHRTQGPHHRLRALEPTHRDRLSLCGRRGRSAPSAGVRASRSSDQRVALRLSTRIGLVTSFIVTIPEREKRGSFP